MLIKEITKGISKASDGVPSIPDGCIGMEEF
jgi:hypothetical protein